MQFPKKGQPVVVHIQATVPWELAQAPLDGHWFGVCRPLNLNAIGDTWAEFQECANEAIQLLLQDLLGGGELEAFLQRNGWRTAAALPAPGTKVRFDFPMAAQQKSCLDELIGAGM
ncbi:MAG: hypothetical protein NTU91_00910 [Chloroflexi bacterium]|nr:hypothetical protein [Chloroflexota bacterium]